MFQVYIVEAFGDNKKKIPPKTFGIGPIWESPIKIPYQTIHDHHEISRNLDFQVSHS